jgi:hypothetical protein
MFLGVWVAQPGRKKLKGFYSRLLLKCRYLKTEREREREREREKIAKPGETNFVSKSCFPYILSVACNTTAAKPCHFF